MVIYEKEDLKLFKEIYKNNCLGESEVRQIIGKNRLNQLNSDNTFNIILNSQGVRVYFLNRKSTQAINKYYSGCLNFKKLAESISFPKLNSAEIRFLKTLALSGGMLFSFAKKNLRDVDILNLSRVGLIEFDKIDKSFVIKLSSIGVKYIKKLGFGFIRKFSDVSYSTYLTDNYIKMSTEALNDNLIYIKDKEAFLRKKTLLAKGSYVILDIEATNTALSSCSNIIEIGAIKVSNGKVIDSFQTLIHYNKLKVPNKIKELTGISTTMLRRKGLHLYKAIKKLLSFIGNCPVVAHGLENDWQGYIAKACYKLNIELPTNHVIDSFRLFEFIRPNSKNGLMSLIQFYDIDITDYPPHRALNDCFLTFKVIECAFINNTNKMANVG